MKDPRFTLADAERAHDDWSCNCGPGALAAILDLTLEEVHPLIPGFDAKRYTNPTMMNAALRNASRPFKKIGALWPGFGLVRIQWEGPWTEPGVPMAARYRFTHWVGTELRTADAKRGVFDINCMNNGSGWCSLDDWAGNVAPWLAALYPQSTGLWHVTHGLEVVR